MITVDGQKMGKSLNNFITLKQAYVGSHEKLMRRYDPLAVRQLILNSHYRSPLDFSDAALYAAQSGFDKITKAVIEVRKLAQAEGNDEADAAVIEQLEQLKAKFEEAMNDDLNTSVALSVVFELVRLSNGLIEKDGTSPATFGAVDELFTKLGGDVLGIVPEEYMQASEGDEEMIDGLVKVLIEQRSQARGRKDFAAADAVRDQLAEIGIVLEDKPGETIWRRK
jgi:cysteinyl-tRNA synthetase